MSSRKHWPSLWRLRAPATIFGHGGAQRGKQLNNPALDTDGSVIARGAA